MNDDLKSIYDFIIYSARLREVTRHNNATQDRKESVAEHSWHLALMAWALRDSFEKEFKAHLNLEKMLKLCLMHDIVEIEAGDPSVWSKDHNVGKAEREEAIAQQRFAELPPALSEELLSLWHEYERGESLESKIVRGVDRLNPALMRFITKQGWADVDGTTKTLDDIQLPRVAFSETLGTLYAEIKSQAVAQGLLKDAEPIAQGKH